MKSLNFEKIKENLLFTINRFSFSVILVFIVSLLLSIIVDFNKDFFLSEDEIFRFIATFFIMFLFSIGVYLFCESLKKSLIYSNISQVLTILFGIFFYIYFKIDFFDNIESVIFMFLTCIGITAFIFCAYSIKNALNSDKYDQKKYFNYFYNMILSLFYSYIFGIFLLLGGLMAIGAVDMLFDFNYGFNDLYSYWTIFSLSFSAPFFFLLKIPSKDVVLENISLNKFVEFLVKYLLISFVVIYFLILYSYTIKVLLNFSQWPKGEVTWLVIGFSILGYLSYIFSYPLEKENNLIKKFRKILPIAIIPQVFMLFYAIYLRINQYDLTINRYFVVVFGLWLLSISLYFIFSKKKFLAFVFFLLLDFTILISIGPWSVYSLPESRQMQKLEQNLEKAGILEIETRKITPLKDYGDIDEKLSEEIYSGIDYLCDFDNCNSIKKLFPKEYILADNNGDGIYEKWGIVRAISETIKVKIYYSYQSKTDINDYEFINFSINNDKNLYPLELLNYDFILELGLYRNTGFSLTQDLERGLILYKNSKGENIDEFDFKIIEKKLLDLVPDFSSENSLTKEDLTFDLSGKKYDLRLYATNISIKNPKYIKTNINRYGYTYFYGMALFKEKK